ncbi:MAG TPA: dimethylsulfonioproprionate lyase family protein [Polyangiaceae bacterium]|nr:dimethylsulfonioproprionate lyase family protein [Polyangiaceae bacterium]
MSKLSIDEGAAWELFATALEPVAPPSIVRMRLVTEVEGWARYLPFVTELSRRFALTRERVRQLLAMIDEPGRWTPGIDPIQGSMHFSPGAALAPLHGGFVRMLPGTRFPKHRHRESELTFVLEGELSDGDGVVYRPGDALQMEPGSVHALGVASSTPALIALLNGRIEMLGE